MEKDKQITRETLSDSKLKEIINSDPSYFTDLDGSVLTPNKFRYILNNTPHENIGKLYKKDFEFKHNSISKEILERYKKMDGKVIFSDSEKKEIEKKLMNTKVPDEEIGQQKMYNKDKFQNLKTISTHNSYTSYILIFGTIVFIFLMILKFFKK